MDSCHHQDARQHLTTAPGWAEWQDPFMTTRQRLSIFWRALGALGSASVRKLVKPNVLWRRHRILQVSLFLGIVIVHAIYPLIWRATDLAAVGFA